MLAGLGRQARPAARRRGRGRRRRTASWRCRPMKTRPSGLVIAGQAIGSTVASVTGRSPYCSTSSGVSAAARRRPAPARAARSTPPRRRVPRTAGERRCRGPSAASPSPPLPPAGELFELASATDRGCFRRLLTARQPRGSGSTRGPATAGVGARGSGGATSPRSAGAASSAHTLCPSPSRSTPHSVGERGHDVQATTVDGVRPDRPDPWRGARPAVGDPDLDHVGAGAGTQPPGHPDHSAGQRVGVPDRVADQFGQRRPPRRRAVPPGWRRRVPWPAVAGLSVHRSPGAGPPRTTSVQRSPSPRHVPPRTPESIGTGHPRGSRTSATVPPPSRGRRETHPFCRSTIRRTR